MKHLTARFFKDSTKSYAIANEIFDDLYQIFDDSNRRINALNRLAAGLGFGHVEQPDSIQF
jgi:hypothetical protein